MVKGRQQEVWPVLVAAQYIGDYYFPLDVQYMFYVPLVSFLYDLFIDIKYVTFTWTETIWA